MLVTGFEGPTTTGSESAVRTASVADADSTPRNSTSSTAGSARWWTQKAWKCIGPSSVWTMVATGSSLIGRTEEGPMHFQAFWVHHRAAPTVEDVEFRGVESASATDPVLTALEDPVVIGPSNPVTSVGPMLALEGVREALSSTTVVAVSPFVEDAAFSGPAGKLMAATGRDPSTAGVAAAYPFADAFVLDEADATPLDRPVVRTDTALGTPADGRRVCRAVRAAFDRAGAEVT